MKRSIKTVAAVLAAGLAGVTFVGCGGGGTSTDANKTEIEISFWEGSFGVDYMNDIKTAFETKYPDYAINLRTSKNAATIANSLQKGANDTTDIYMNQAGVLNNYTDVFADLEDIATEKIDGEDKSIAEKYDASLYNSLRDANGDIKMLGWAGSVTGIFYNADLVTSVPRTTKELADLVANLGRSETPAFVQFKDARMGYYQYLVKSWMAQYAGLDYYNNNWLPLADSDGNSPSKEVYLSETDGKKQALEVLGSVLSEKTVIEESGDLSMAKFKVARKFKLGEAAMTVNGNWIFGEDSELKNKNIGMMRTPVISALAEKLDTVGDDEELASLVSAIDNVIDNGAEVSLKGEGYDVSKADWDTVMAARKIVYHNGSEHAMIVNKYTNVPDGVKKFIQFYYSDEGLSKFVNATHFASNAYITDSSVVSTSEWTSYEKEQYARSNKSTYVTDGNSISPVFSNTSTIHIFGTVDVVGQLTTTNNAQTAAQLWEAFKTNVNENWSNWVYNAGL